MIVGYDPALALKVFTDLRDLWLIESETIETTENMQNDSMTRKVIELD